MNYVFGSHRVMQLLSKAESQFQRRAELTFHRPPLLLPLYTNVPWTDIIVACVEHVISCVEPAKMICYLSESDIPEALSIIQQDSGNFRLVHHTLKGLCHGQKCFHLFSDSEVYHEQIGPIPSSNGSLDIALSMCIFRALDDALRPSMQLNRIGLEMGN